MHVYQVPLIPTDLRHEEAMRLSINAINSMKNVVQSVLEKIELRTAKYLERLERIDSRLELASKKIEALKDSKKAVIIYSPNKYPETLKDFEPTFQRSAGQQPALKRVKAEEIQNALDPISNKNPKEKLQFYHVRFDDKKSPKKMPSKFGVHVPLQLIRSVDSLLVFRQDEKHDKSKGSSNSSFPIDSGRKLDAAPVSMTNKAHNRQIADELFYTPGMDTAPELDVPTDLPNLPGIAGDISFSQDDDFMIVPSHSKLNLSIQADSVDMPQPQPIVEQAIVKPPSSDVTKNSNRDESIPVPAPRTVAAPAPPVAPVPAAPKNDDYIIPPPPPPPPPAAFNLPVPAPSTVKSQEVPQSNEARSNLMAAIRSAGGKTKLRAAADRVPKNEKVRKDKAASTAPVGDFMSDLRNRLTMRRKGISGAKDGSSQQPQQQPKLPEPATMISRLSQLIPPPSFTDEDLPREEGSDEDWN